MYSLVFYYFYRYFDNQGDRTMFSAACGLFLVFGLHIILLYVIVQKVVGHLLLTPLSQDYGTNKLIISLMILPLFVLFLIYFNSKRRAEIVERMNNNSKVFSAINWIGFVIVAVMPLIAIITILRN